MTEKVASVREIVLWSNPDKDEGLRLFSAVREHLRRYRVRVRVPLRQKERMSDREDIFLPEETLFAGADAAIVLGGDGTILQAAEGAIAADCPILGVNLGRVGYMADVGREELFLLDRLFSGEATVSERMTLEVATETDGAWRVICPFALNDAVLVSERPADVVGIRVSYDGAEVARHRGDGVIVATPTGSTAYSLSAGGPVLDPSLDCLCVTPICSTSPAARAMIFSGEGDLLMRGEDAERRFYLTCDGAPGHTLAAGVGVRIRKSGKKARLISLKDDAFFQVLRKKTMSAI